MFSLLAAYGPTTSVGELPTMVLLLWDVSHFPYISTAYNRFERTTAVMNAVMIFGDRLIPYLWNIMLQ